MKPPQNPTMRNRDTSFDILVCLLVDDHNSPMSKLPSMFTVNVPSGKVDMFFNARETIYRNMPPKQLPAPTISISFIIKTIFNSSHPPLHKGRGRAISSKILQHVYRLIPLLFQDLRVIRL